MSLSSTEFRKVAEVKVKHNSFLTDNLGNLYLLNNKTISKYSKTGEKLSDYSNNMLGEISYADVSDPFRILLFYKDLNRIQYLNNQLAEINSAVQLDELEGVMAEIVCSSSLGGFWVYDYNDSKLKYYDKNLIKKHESVNLNTIAENVGFVDLLLEKNDFVYLHSPEAGILLFDKFGSFYKRISNIKTSEFQIANQNIVYYKNNCLFTYNPNLFSTDSILIPIENCNNARIEKNMLFAGTGNEVVIYAID